MVNVKHILVTGGNGLLGSHVLKALRGVYKLETVTRAYPDEPIAGVTYHVLDLSSSWDARVLPPTVDAVIHLAQSSRYREFPERALDVFLVNVDSTARLLNYAYSAGAKKFIYASSGGVYGTGPHPFQENSPLGSIDSLGYYLGSKLSGEVLVQSYADLMEVSVLRIFFMYGNAQKRSMLLPRLVDLVRDGRPVTLDGEDGIRINPVHVRDAVRVVQSCLAMSGNLTLNVAGPTTMSIRDIAGLIGERVDRDPLFVHTGDQPRDLVGDNRRMIHLVGEGLTPLSEGIVDVL